jgi:TRAP-type C4-dicarboxylate transport system substrate-binding protein
MFVVMNKDKWNSLSKADQEAIETINEEWVEKQGQLWNALSREGREYAIQKGVKFVRASKEEEAKTAEKMKPVLAEYVKDMKSRGLPGDEALKFCLEYIKSHP